jgi:uncharacterized protein Yka (UPF0111/DUF47 family)
MFGKIKAKLEAEAKEKTKELLAFLAHELKLFTNSIERVDIEGLDKAEGLDDDLVKDIEEIHAKADALEAKIRAKLAADTGTPSTTGDAAKASADGSAVASEKEASAAKAEPEAATSDAEVSKS